MNAEDRRRFRRVGCRIPCVLQNIDADSPHPSKTVVSDISEGGIRFGSHLNFSLSEEKYVSLDMPGQKTIIAKVKSVWTNWVFRLLHYETGARFVDIGLENRYAIKEFVNSKL